MVLSIRLLPTAIAAIAFSLVGVPAVLAEPSAQTAADSITVVGATDGVLEIGSTGPSLDATVALRAGRVPAEVTAHVTVFRNGDSEAFMPTVDNPVQFNGRLGTVHITAPLPYGGSFVADLVITHDGVEGDPVTLHVTRSRAPATVTVEGVPTASAVSTGWERQTVHRSVVVTETSGRVVTLGPVAVVNASGRQGEQTSAAEVTITGLHTVEPPEACTVDRERRSITVQAGRACQLDVVLTLPASPGSYDLTLRFAAPGSAPVDDRVTVQLRRSGWVAAAVIAAGVGAAILLALVLRPRRERHKVQLDTSRVRDRLTSVGRRATGPDTDPLEQVQVEGLHRVLDVVHHLAGSDPALALARLEVAETQVDQLGAWVSLNRAIRASEPPVGASMLAKWHAVTADITDPTLPADRADALAQRLSEVDELRVEAGRRAVRAEIDRLTRALPQLGPGAVADDITALLQQATADLDAEDPDVEDAAIHLTHAQNLAAAAVERRISELVRVDATALDMPVDPDTWQTVQTRVRELIARARTAPPADRLEVLRAAESCLVSGTAEAFGDHVRGLQQQYRAGAPKERGFAAHFDAVLAPLSTVPEAVDRGDLAAARAAYEEAVRAWREVQQQAVAEFGRHLGPAAQAADPPGAPPDLVPRPIGWARRRVTTGETPTRPSSSALRSSRRRTEMILAAFAGVLAVLLGLSTLYLGRATWGGPIDVITAALWGLGITTAAGAAGFTAIHNDITK